MTIDWTKPLELMDGTPVRLRETGFQGGPNPDSDGDYWVEAEDGRDIHNVFTPSGRHTDDVFLRNRPDPSLMGQVEASCISIREAIAKFNAITASTKTLRDEFAMAALTGMCSSQIDGNYAEYGEMAYRHADAMMAARK